ncbi:hypothetical protein [Gracilibacillus saliphilus]|uniref:hypothetical protein n=1 Tax=Gracilibacillus saliphilus TaxID=543890 RepID=UPI0013D50E8F|nr:hypothetical protein [Gracilibacillus saliphilus]
MEVNAELYDFLKENETGMMRNENGVIAYVHIPFFKLDDFVEIVGVCQFDEGGIEVQLFDTTVCVDLNDIIENEGHSVISYENCFEESELKPYEEELLTMS